MMADRHDLARAFTRTFAHVEYCLKRSGYLRPKRDVAEADWDAFVHDLGPAFFKAMVDRELAKTLIGEPPRRLLADLQWSPEIPTPLTNVQGLIIKGV